MATKSKKAGTGQERLTLKANQLRALSSEPRFRLFHLMIQKEVSMADAEVALSVSEKSLYYHLRILLKAGLIHETGTRNVGRKPQKLYRAVAEGFRMDPDLNDPDQFEAALQNADAMLRATWKEYRQSLQAKQSDRLLIRGRLKMDPKRIKEAEEHLTAFVREFSSEGDTAVDFAFTSVLCRVPERED